MFLLVVFRVLELGGDLILHRSNSVRYPDSHRARRSILFGRRALFPSASAKTAFFWRHPPGEPLRECHRLHPAMSWRKDSAVGSVITVVKTSKVA